MAQEKVAAFFFVEYIFILGMSTTVSNTTFVKKNIRVCLFYSISFFISYLHFLHAEWKV